MALNTTNDGTGAIIQGRLVDALDADRAGVVVPWDASLVEPPFTIEVWAKPAGREAADALVECGRPSSCQHAQLHVTRDGHLAAQMHGHSPWQVTAERATSFGWHCYAMSFDGTQLRLAVDGEIFAERMMTPGKKPLREGPFVIGTNLDPGSGQASQAVIEQVRLSRVVRDLTASPPRTFEADDDTAGLWFPGDVGEIGVVVDRSGNGRDGTLRTMAAGVSLDELDAASFNAGPSPIDGPVQRVTLTPATIDVVLPPPSLSLGGVWQMAEGGDVATRLGGPWADAIDAVMPGSVHTALQAAGRIPDPKVGKNDALAREQGFKPL